jgi:hypothetical protein
MCDQYRDGRTLHVAVNECTFNTYTVKLHDILEVKDALIKSVYCMTECIVCSLFFIPLNSIIRLFSLGLHLSRRSGNLHEASPPQNVHFVVILLRIFFWCVRIVA